jgi:aryl-alcohol dehydrogenase-like predicted oxidoreductase
LCGAKRPDQIRDNAAALGWQLTQEQIAQIDRAIAARGPIASRAAVT